LTSPVIASVVNNTLTSTTGDMIYASAANTPARLGIGSSAQVLTVAGGIPSWATASSGGMTLISETVASGLSSLSLSSIAGTFKQLVLIWCGVYHSDNSSTFSIRFNNDSTASAYCNNAMTGSGSTNFNSGAIDDTFIVGNGASFTIYPFGQSVNNSTSYFPTMAQGFMTIDNYASTSKVKNFQTNFGYYKNAGTTGYANVQMIGQWKNISAITSIDVVRIGGSGTFTNATDASIRLYGVS